MAAEAQPALFSQTRVVHCKRERFDVYIGRPSKWGNPFQLQGKRSRFKTQPAADPISAYREWILTQPELMAALPELRGKVLGCWCKPGPCHGDVLAELADAS